METIEWNEGQRKAFQDLLREFVASIDAKMQEEKQTGKTPKIPKWASYQRELNKFLASWGYACKISLGSGNLSHKPSIAFCRQDILGEGFVNGEKPTPKIYDDLEAHLEKITNDFLRFANEFNQIPTTYFELEPSSASH
ncbi:hypothetical protein HPPN120_00560 [Helicobacter pylori Puno120]|uniref:hypothetical protein n=1 Tax=Helicobacter pylori TaxID=210 RepID=UPI0002290EE5|nr:hypothetical protein [Helicobacter pylori]AEN14759.1 hypothetical protein HPPN120_00560 [Helicobacter pylori Puno120]